MNSTVDQALAPIETSVDVKDLHLQLKNALIMMVDDEPILMEVLQAFLEEEGYQNFVTVEESSSALDVMRKRKPDIVLLDLKMPEVTGFEILEQVRADKNLQRVPVIVLTSSSDPATKLKALELGATDFLAKPVDASELALRLRNTLTVKAYQDELTFYDALTGLPNRARFLERLDWSLKSAQRSGDAVSVLKVSIDRFNQINGTLGPNAGDSLLRQVANRLNNSVRLSDVVSHTGRDDIWQNLARLGGDEFSILLPGGNASEDAAYVANRILSVLRDSFDIDGHEVFVTGSAGIAVYPEDALTTDSLMKNSGAAAEFAKQQGRDNYQFYSKEINKRAKERLNVESQLRRAIENKQFVLHYQPKVNVATGKVTSMEALVRWQHPERGLLSPYHFISIAEGASLIADIGEWVIYEACRQNKIWQSEGLGFLDIAVNVSSQQFAPKYLQKTLDAAIKSGMDLKYLVIEITESMLMGDEERTIDILNKIRKAGPKLSIDDFGTGYSSFGYLKRFPVDELKIDRSFLTEVPQKKDDCAIVRAIIAMAESLEMSVVAEGVERQDQLDFLSNLKCDVIQGFFFSKPLPADEFAKYVRAKNS